MAAPQVLPHNARPAAVWGSAGSAYDRISATVADAIDHCVLRLAPKPGERILDVATGTGWTARRVAAQGATVLGVDIGAELVEAARALSRAEGLDVEFRVGDAERLDLPDASFDAVISTFGVMFVQDPPAAARELARVCRPGGRLVLATWPPGDTIAGMFGVLKPYMPAPAGTPWPSPFEWGTRERVRELLGASFDLKFETGTTVLRASSGTGAWELFSVAYGPTRTLAGNLSADRLERLRADFVAFHDRHSTELGIAMPRGYLVTAGKRKTG